MTGIRTYLIAIVAGIVVGVGGVASASSGDSEATRGTALVVDASVARDGRDLVDQRLEAVDAEVRIPRTAAEARTSIRYLDELGHRVVVAGPQATAAAAATGVTAVEALGLQGALAAAGR
jgi:hypothetical protein